MSLPYLPVDLCFNHEDFIKNPFSVDQFLQDHRKKANLEMMRDDLGVYLKILRSSMIELINQDYADFVNLSSNLIALDKSISTIEVPLSKLESEVSETKLALDSTIMDIQKLIEKKNSLAQKKRNLKSLSKMQDIARQLERLKNSEMLSTVLLERAAVEYSWLNCHSERCQQYLNDDHRKVKDKISHSIMTHLKETFLEALKNGEPQLDTLKVCLNLFVTLGKRDVAENLIRKEIVAPVLDKIISEDALLSDPRGLEGLYAHIIAFIDNDLKYLLQITQPISGVPIVKGFNIMCHSVWPEIEECLEFRLKSIYALGNPNIFHQKYLETMHFLNELEKRCGNEATVKFLRSQPHYQTFLQKWNLSVYFQLRFQQIASQLEIFLNDCEKYTSISSSSSSPHLMVTNTVWVCLNQCWASNIFIEELAHRFWKLSFQILARFCSWILNIPKESFPSPVTLSRQQFQIYCYSDCEYLIEMLPEFLKLSRSKLESRISDQIWSSMQDSVADTKLQFQSCLLHISKSVIEEVALLSLPHVRSVTEVPRLFRRTNRDNPKQPCSYVAAILGPLTAFSEEYPKHSALWLGEILSFITAQYFSCVEDVIKSVQKTEESLRRLKQIRERSTAESRTSGGDDDKIRQQLLIDVTAYREGIEQLGLSASDIKRLPELLHMVSEEVSVSKRY